MGDEVGDSGPVIAVLLARDLLIRDGVAGEAVDGDGGTCVSGEPIGK